MSGKRKKKSVRFDDEFVGDNEEGWWKSDSESEEANYPQAKHQKQLSNDDLLYDPKMDAEDEKWVRDQQRLGLVEGEAQHQTDAILSCPMCMGTICVDCQRHQHYPNQYRAMFVINLHVPPNQILKYYKGKQIDGNSLQLPETSPSADQSKKEKDTEDEVSEEKIEYFYPVCCNACQTEVGVYDKDEVYHLYNVIPTWTS
eukprot:GCRY01002819.1.p1 GENE.GCRY01002819.1~~GCRY01002819.1.p1  ORF type:complete len:200 (+),score=42.17 GCRY01002819.1:245-844(+)